MQDTLSKAFSYGSSSWSYSIITDSKVVTGWNITGLFEARLNNPVKTMKPKINLLSNGRLALVCLDMDSLTLAKKAFGSCVESWEDVRNRILPIFCGDGLILESPSGKAKAFFLVNGVFTTEDAKNWIVSNFDSRLVSTLDLSDSSLSSAFVNGSMVEAITNWLDSNPRIFTHDCFKSVSSVSSIHDLLYLEPLPEKSTEPKEWIDFDGPFTFSQQNPTVQKLVRFLLGNPFLTMKKVGLNQTWLAQRFETSQRTVSKAIKILVESGNLAIITKAYYGSHCARYQATGELLSLCKQVYWVKCGKAWKKPEEGILTLPSSIEDGSWTEVIMNNTKWFKNPNAFMEWITSIPGFNEKGREYKAVSIWNSHARNNGYMEIEE